MQQSLEETNVGWMEVLPFLATAVSGVFTVVVLARFFRRLTPALLLWALGLFMYTIGSLGESLHRAFGWQEAVFRLWYLSGAMLTAAWLGQGTVYLLLPRRVAHILMVLLLLVSLLGLHQVLAAQLQPLAQGEPLSGAAIVGGSFARSLTPVLNIYGTVALVGGALYSAWRTWRYRENPDRMVGNILIACGAMAPALSGTLSRLGWEQYRYLGELIGAVLMFIGFLWATRRPRRPPSPVSETPLSAEGK